MAANRGLFQLTESQERLVNQIARDRLKWRRQGRRPAELIRVKYPNVSIDLHGYAEAIELSVADGTLSENAIAE